MKIKCLAVSLLFATSSVLAQDWPEKQVRVLVPFAVGGTVDIIARVVFDQMSKQTGKNFNIEYKTGASGTIASNMVAKSKPDGYTLLVNTVTHTVVATSFKNIPYDVENDFTNISGLIAQPLVIASSSRWKNIAEVVKYGRENPGKINYGTPGYGSAGHLFIDKFGNAAKIKMVDIPFRGTPEAFVEMMANRLDLFPAPASSIVSLSKDGRINALAVSTNKRSPSLPDVPTMAELGYPDAEYPFWIGVFGPSNMDSSLVSKINNELQNAMSSPEVKAKLVELGAEQIKLSPKAFDSYVKREIKNNAEIVTRSKIVME